jgi:hypothetical protein
MAVCRHIPALADLTAPAFAKPIGPIMPCGGLLNTLRHYVCNERPVALGFFPLGDSLCHTNPAYALGLTFSLIHALELRDALSEISPENAESQMLAYFARIMPEVSERYALSCELDAVRSRLWQGQRVDFSHRDGCYAQFMFVAPAVALQDGDVCRKTLRRIGVLDRLSVFDEEITLLRRVEDLFAKRMAGASLRTPGPQRAELVRIATEHAALAALGN